MSTSDSSTHSRVDIVRAASQHIVMNSYGLPEFIFRPDLLDIEHPEDIDNEDGQTLLDHEQQSDDGAAVGHKGLPARVGSGSQVSVADTLNADGLQSIQLDPRTLQAAKVSLTYADGFPILPSGQPFWGQFEFEPHEAFVAFDTYREQGLTGVRQLFALDEVLKTRLGGCTPSVAQLIDWHILYFWDLRVKAFDLCYEASLRKTKGLLAAQIESKQLLNATKLLEKLQIYLDSEEFMSTLTPKAAIELFKVLTSLQRISVGLPANGVSGAQANEGGAQSGTSFEVLLRQQAKASSDGAPTVLAGKTASDNARSLLLSDPQAAAMAQELIVKITQGGNK